MKIFLTSLVFFGLVFNSSGALHPNDINNGKSTNNDSYDKANCPPSDARLFMEFNDVKALIEVGGSIWQNRQSGVASYEVPVGSGNHVLFSGSIWMGGTDVNGQIKLAAVRFRTQGNDFWGGPLSQNVGSGDYDPSQPVGFNAKRDYGAATIDPDVCIEYNKFFTVRKQDVINYSLAFECNQNPDCDEEYPITNVAINAINNWPAHGDPSRGQDYYLAPFYDYPSNDGAGDGIYDPSQGDTPWFDDILERDDVECGIDRRVTLFGDISHWWVFNDKGNIHTESGGDPIGMEIHAQAFSFATNDAVNRMTFYNYEMINRSTQTLVNTYFSQYADSDVGFAEDDYVGCDVSRGLGYAYNGDNFDEGQSGAPGYGDNPPAVGIDFFEGPYQDHDGLDNVGPHLEEQNDGSFVYVVPTVQEALDGDGIVYEGIGIGYSDGIVDNERYGMRRFNYYNNVSSGPTSDPMVYTEYYNYMQGLWKDGTEIFYGGTGYTSSAGVTSILAAYCFPGDSDPLHWGTAGTDPGFNWSETNIDGSNTANDAGDRRFLQTAGPFTLAPGAVNNLTVGVVYGRSFEGDAAKSIESVRKNDTKAQALFDNCFEILDPPSAPVLDVVELENELVLLISNPYGNNVHESYAEEDNINITDPLDGSPIDKVYRFEGYQIFQLVDETAGVSDIGNEDKARIVAQCDLKNDVASLINFEFNESLGFAIPTLKVEAENRGIRHSFNIVTDAFTGEALVNHKTYYYIAIAYAHNEYKPYDPMDPNLVDGQQTPYISSRLAADGSAIKATAGIPHSPQPGHGGANLNIAYGVSPQITTLDGTGNGGLAVELTKESEDFILANGSIDNPTYQAGHGPVDIKVIDPINVASGYYKLQLTDVHINPSEEFIDSAKWILERYTEKGGTLIESITSDRSISALNEQLIPEWGISLNISQSAYNCGGIGSKCYLMSEPLESSITFADSSKRWLSGISYESTFGPTNWIGSGVTTPTEDEIDSSLGLYNPGCYKDYAGYDDNKLYTRILDGTLTAGFLTRRNTCGFMPIGTPTSIGININSLASNMSRIMLSIYQPSIDIVFTSDKSKWTRVPVIELGNDPALNQNGGKPGLLRQAPSVDKNGNSAGDPGYNASEADPNGTSPTGMGWFPGYAVDVETGKRLNMAFGENSFLAGQNGGDMLWNPTSNVYSPTGFPLLGGQHILYVFGRMSGYTISGNVFYEINVPTYDEGEYIHSRLSEETTDGYLDVYRDLSWVYNPLLVDNRELLATDARIKVRINKKYANYNQTGAYGGNPTYEWNMDPYVAETNNPNILADALDMINVVPNPYYAYSEYERGRLDTRIKITNLPERCKVRIYNTSGKLIRSFDKDSPITSLDWDLNNGEGIPVAGGVYLIHVAVDGVGERVVKFFGGMRQPDLENL